MTSDRSGTRHKPTFAGLTLLLSCGITATYHLGYAQFRGGDLVKPEIDAAWIAVAGAVVWWRRRRLFPTAGPGDGQSALTGS